MSEAANYRICRLQQLSVRVAGSTSEVVRDFRYHGESGPSSIVDRHRSAWYENIVLPLSLPLYRRAALRKRHYWC